MPDILTLQKRLSPLLAPLGGLYAFLMRLRRLRFETARRGVWRPDCPVVSVGNIGWGGSGKTPLCRHILDWAEAHEEHALVLTRGYGAKPHRLPLLVTPEADPARCGDEPLLLLRGHGLARVVVDPVRRRSGPWAYKAFDPDFVLLDDGFQHLAAARDIDLVLLTPQDLGSGWNRVFPAGSWREGKSALARATAFLVKTGAADGAEILAAAANRLKDFGRPVYSFSLVSRGLDRLDGKRQTPDLGGAEYVFASGIADPRQAAATAERLLGRPPRRILPFADHHGFAPADVQRLSAAAEGAEVVVTAKDAVKLGRLPGAEGFWCLRTTLEFGPALSAAAPFDAWFAGRLGTLAEKYRSTFAGRETA